ncbi:calcium-activated potassium channel subunit beta-2-like isoform X1 [Exaiptasia diaphana]|uniref:Calcium-activated potassium channel subunit beta-2 n=1 Tax=Exaiptasia diaphana TaxID=2652724 RepID=A0A913WZ69_EXADI|nr:calcium-activated potassium channel subunit beta-2-like isoform X1 [Exaiptasia diaphana]
MTNMAADDKINVNGIRISLALLESEPKNQNSKGQYLAAGMALITFGLMLWTILGVTCANRIVNAYYFKETLCHVVEQDSYIIKNQTCQCVEVTECQSYYPCIQLKTVFHTINDNNKVITKHGILYNTIYDVKSECSYSPRCSTKQQSNVRATHLFLSSLLGNRNITCYYNPADHKEVILKHDSHVMDLFHALLWPFIFVLSGVMMFYKYCRSLQNKKY